MALVAIGLHVGCKDPQPKPHAEPTINAGAKNAAAKNAGAKNAGAKNTGAKTPGATTATAAPVKAGGQPHAKPHPALQLQMRSVAGRSYALLSPRYARWAITLTRPSKTDLFTVLAVPGTYTSPQNVVEGVVMIDGQLVHQESKPWEAILRVETGAVQIQRAQSDSFSDASLEPLKQAKASLLQGHLLVYAGKERPLRPSPQLQRRALASMAQGPVVIESQSPVPLAQLASDIVALGGTAAMNLDMGAWSEGWYRTADNTTFSIGHDRSATERQSNWLVLRMHAVNATTSPKD